MLHIDLFAGAGGLAIGLKQAGFPIGQLYELNSTSCATLRFNTISGTLNGSQVVEGDVSAVRWHSLSKQVGLLAAGAPCQPFSLGGRHLADRDGRNLFPEVFRAIRLLGPSAILLENVKGLTRPSFRPYFDYIIRQLEYPKLRPKKDELWQAHNRRLETALSSRRHEPEYTVRFRVLDAADYGVPQSRQRVFIVATRRPLPAYQFPAQTHSKQALFQAQADGSYWERHGIRPQRSDRHSPSLAIGESHLPWMTVRDAVADLPRSTDDPESAWMNHWAIPGARAYKGHAGSILDLPAKTIKAGVHGVPGGENMLLSEDGSVRYFTLREIARLQTFPDSHFFVGARTHVTRQIGNAVPCRLARAVAEPLLDLLAANPV